MRIKLFLKRATGTLTCLVIFLSVTFAQSINKQFFNDAGALLKANVKNGLIDYEALQSSNDLTSLIAVIANANISSLDANTIQAFYINAYNLNVINEVVKSYPTKSVLDRDGFFDRNIITVANIEMTLNELEKTSLLSVYKDVRFHFVLVCGAKGCPPITNFAYAPATLEEQLEQQTKTALNDPSFIKTTDDSVELSEIFKWYASDFGENNEAILSFINTYRNKPIATSTDVKYYSYDWSLNDLQK